MQQNKEMLEKAKTAKSVEELITLAKENGIELTEEKATAYFEKLNAKSEELADDELDNVSGGVCEDKGKTGCPKCGSQYYGTEYSRSPKFLQCRDCNYVYENFGG